MLNLFEEYYKNIYIFKIKTNRKALERNFEKKNINPSGKYNSISILLKFLFEKSAISIWSKIQINVTIKSLNKHKFFCCKFKKITHTQNKNTNNKEKKYNFWNICSNLLRI